MCAKGRDDATEVAQDILRSLRGILHAVTTHSKRLARDTGLTLPQLACLRAVERAGGDGATIVTIARELGTSPPTVTGIVDRLEKAQLVHRHRSQVDRRKVFVVLTDEGVSRLRLAPKQVQELFVTGVMSLDPLARTVVQQSLHRILELLEADDFDAAPILAAEEHLTDP